MLYSRSILALVPLLPICMGSAVAPNGEESPRTDDIQLDKELRCGLGKDFHAGRRAELRSRLEGGIVFMRGRPDTRDYVEFHQDKAFWYLTGVESPNAALIMDVESGREILLLPMKNTGLEGWEGEKWDAEDDWMTELTGFGEIRRISAQDDLLKELSAKDKKIWISGAAHVELMGCYDRADPFNRKRKEDPLDGRMSREEALAENLERIYSVEVKDCAPMMAEMRRVKTAEEIAALRVASDVGARSMMEAMRSTRPGIGEWELDALMSWVYLREGAAGPAYAGIVGSGPNALTLHYFQSTRALRGGEMILIDFGPEVDHYITDITRTWPTDGVFTPRMAELYDVVLEAQEAGIAATKPGVTMRDVNKACMEVIKRHEMTRYVRHGFVHYVGMEVHDVGKGSAPLEPGVAFTIEPGLYEAETNIGIRIEDVVLVTETGCEVLSALVPRDREEISRLIASEGVLDTLSKTGR